MIRNIIIVWFLTGLWHGASWNFILWGLYFGLILLIEKLILNRFFNINSRLYALILILIGWVIFAFDNFADGFMYLKSMFAINGNLLIDTHSLYILTSNIVLIMIGILSATSIPKKAYLSLFKNKDDTWSITIAKSIFILLILILATASLVNNSYNPFLYFRF